MVLRYVALDKIRKKQRRMIFCDFSTHLVQTHTIVVIMYLHLIDRNSAQDHTVQVGKFQSLSALRYLPFCYNILHPYL